MKYQTMFDHFENKDFMEIVDPLSTPGAIEEEAKAEQTEEAEARSLESKPI